MVSTSGSRPEGGAMLLKSRSTTTDPASPRPNARMSFSHFIGLTNLETPFRRERSKVWRSREMSHVQMAVISNSTDRHKAGFAPVYVHRNSALVEAPAVQESIGPAQPAQPHLPGIRNPKTSISDMNFPICFGGKLITAATCRPGKLSGV